MAILVALATSPFSLATKPRSIATGSMGVLEYVGRTGKWMAGGTHV